MTITKLKFTCCTASVYILFFLNSWSIIAVVGAACATVDAAAAADMHVTASASAYSSAVTGVNSQCNEAISTCTTVKLPAGTCKQAIITKNSSYLSVLELLCTELSMKPPTVEVSKKSEACTSTLSVSCGFTSSESHAKKGDAQEDAARVALLTLKEGNVENGKNCRAQLNEYCQQQQCKKEFVLSDSGPFSCTVFVQIIQTSLACPTEDEAKDKAAYGILTRLGHASHILQMFDDQHFERFSVSFNPPSLFTLTARYRFNSPSVGERSRKNAEKNAAEHALLVLYPDLDPKPQLDHCKNKLQEMYPSEHPTYDSLPGDDGLYQSEVSVTFSEQMSCDNIKISSLDASDDLAGRALKRLRLIS